MYSDQYKCVFVHINKNGGTNINNALEMIPESEFQHLSIKRILALKSGRRSYFKFSFVRNPWDWVVSEFHFRKQKTRTIPPDEEFNVEALDRYFGSDSCSWAEMLYFNLRMTSTGYQKSFLYVDGNLSVDYVGRFERYVEHLGEVCSILGIEGGKKREVLARHENATIHLPYRQYYNEETKERVRRMFEEDIDTFKYAF